MTIINLTDKETTIREKLIKAGSEGKQVLYSDVI